MTGLLSLPEEILTEIYILSGQQIESLSHLSCVNRRLHDIWIKDSDHIIASAVRLVAPNHEDAIALTLLEMRLPKRITGFHSFDPSEPCLPLRSCLPGLRRSLTVGIQVCEHFLEWNVLEEENDVRVFVLEPLPPVYYFIREMVVAFHLPQLRLAMNDKIIGFFETAGAVENYAMMSNFMLTDMAPSLQVPHCIERPCPHPINSSGDQNLMDVTHKWGFALKVGWNLLVDREDGLPDDPFSGYYPDGGPEKDCCTHSRL